MATATAPPAAPALVPHRFTVADYYRMLEIGVLDEDDRVELLGGQVVDMSPMGPPHAAAEQARDVLQAALGARAQVRDSKPLGLGEYDEPLPDLAIVRPRPDRYAAAHPTAADVFWLVEVAESSLARDQWAKAAIYAAAGVREVWVVNLPERVLEVYRDAGPAGYLDRQTHRRGERVAPLAFPELALAVADLLPPGATDQEREADERQRGPAPER